MSRSPDVVGAHVRRLLRLAVAPVVLVASAVGASMPAGAADPSPSSAPTLVTPTAGATATSLAGLSAPVRSYAPPAARDIVVSVESFDGAETQRDTDTRRTLILDARVLFAEDRAVLSPVARARIRQVAKRIGDAEVTGVVQVNGYTDDQGSARHGLMLSRQRAAAVRAVLQPSLSRLGVRLVIRGYGEADPRLPNRTKDGTPIPANQAENRRVEITFLRGSAG